MNDASRDISPLKRELRDLRRGKGVTPDSLAKAPHVMAALDATNAETAYVSFKKILRTLGDDRESRALYNVYRFQDDAVDAGTVRRREDFGLDNGGYKASEIWKWENLAVDRLEKRLSNPPSIHYGLSLVVNQSRMVKQRLIEAHYPRWSADEFTSGIPDPKTQALLTDCLTWLGEHVEDVEHDPANHAPQLQDPDFYLFKTDPSRIGSVAFAVALISADVAAEVWVTHGETPQAIMDGRRKRLLLERVAIAIDDIADSYYYGAMPADFSTSTYFLVRWAL